MRLKGLYNQIKNQFATNNKFANTFKNSYWLILEKVFNMIIGLVVTALIARYFGPDNFGEFNYALAFVTLFTVLSTLGLETLVVKYIIEKEVDEGTILFTSFILRVVGGLLLTVLSTTIINIIEPNNNITHILVFILSLMMIFKAFEVIEYWIQAHQKAKISSLIRMITYLVIACLKISLVIFGGTLIDFSLLYLLNTVIVGIVLFLAYIKFRKEKFKLSFKFEFARTILSQSWPLIISGLMVTLYMHIDKVMLGIFLDSKTEVGIYSAATAISQIWYFVPMAIIISFKPIIISSKKEDEKKYYSNLELLYTIIIWLSIGFGLFIFIFSSPIINLLYGADYLPATNILTINVWAGLFAMIGTVSSIWLILEGFQKYKSVFVFGGAFVNISLNILLIPKFGGFGAAIATLISQFIANIFLLLLFKNVRNHLLIILHGFTFKILRNRNI